MYDVKCPYCGYGQEINHDDGVGYEEDTIHQQDCTNCNKTFTYTTSISYYYDAEKAPCLNGEFHDWQPVVGIPESVFKNRFRCSYCEKEKYGEEKK